MTSCKMTSRQTLLLIMESSVKSSFVDTCHWSRELKCDVCFDYFNEPHTLVCGHSFCTYCLKRLAQSSRDQHRRSGSMSTFNKVKFYCPTCRHGTLAKQFLKDDTSVSFVLRDVTNGWKDEKELFSEGTRLRSVSSQTPNLQLNRWPENIITNLLTADANHERVFPTESYIKKAMEVTDSEEERRVPNFFQFEEGNYSTDANSSSPDSTGNETDSDWDNFNNVGQPEAQQAADDAGVGFQILWSPGRIALTIFWFVYTAMEMFRCVDKDGDGKVTLQEYMGEMEKINPKDLQRADFERAFEMIDQDNSRTLDGKELKTLFQTCGQNVNDDQVKEIIKKLDKDGDGLINIDEFLTLFKF